MKWKDLGGRPVVYVAHPFTPTEEEISKYMLPNMGRGTAVSAACHDNRERASRWVAWVANSGFCPQATWIVLTGQWTEKEGRELGLELDKMLIARCDELWLVGGRISSGMQIEREEAERLGIRVQDLTHLGKEPPRRRKP